jgi:hypothetical protein
MIPKGLLTIKVSIRIKLIFNRTVFIFSEIFNSNVINLNIIMYNFVSFHERTDSIFTVNKVL